MRFTSFGEMRLGKKRMLKRFFTSNSFMRIELEQPRQQVKNSAVNPKK